MGDVAGMGADLYESYCGSVLATAALGAAAFITVPELQFNAILAPMLIAAFGVILSLLGIFMVKTKEGASQLQLLRALDRGINTSSVLIVAASFLVIHLLGLSYWICGSVITGLLTGIVIGKATEYYTSHAYKPTQDIAKSSETGPATVIIKGIGTGMISTAIPVITIVVGIILAYLFAAQFDMTDMSMGLYGVGIAAVGMLSTLGITLATDAYGPIADNAGGNAEMSELGAEVRQRTDALDALGNTTAATGKGFAIGSAALTGLALLASYIEEIKIGLIRLGHTTLEVGGKVVDTASAGLKDMMTYYDVNLMNPKVLAGVFIGSMMAFLFCGLTMNAVGRAAQKMVNEVRRQFREIKGIMEGKAEPDYARCVEISTRGLGSGFVLAVFMANSGGAWDNAKKYVEEGHLGGKGSECHKATVIGDTVGDPFKDTSGPSLNILIKLMSMVAIVMAGVTCMFSLL